MQRLNVFPAVLPGFGTEFLDLLSQNGKRRLRGHCLTKCDGDSIRDLSRHLGKETASFKAEDAAPEPVEVHGYNASISVLDDPLQASSEGQKRSGSGELAFRKNTHHFPFLEILPGIAQRPQDHSRSF